jgi:hypothetical protein
MEAFNGRSTRYYSGKAADRRNPIKITKMVCDNHKEEYKIEET